jgi:type I restriction enzyme M protein
VLFFERTGGTTDVWFYECEPAQKLTKNKPIKDEHLQEFVDLFATRQTTPNSWLVSAEKLKTDFDLSAKNPAKQQAAQHLAPSDLLAQLRIKEAKVSSLLDEIEGLLTESGK